MARYILGFHGGGGMAQTEEEQAAVMGKWGAWYEALGASVLDGGAPTSVARTVSAEGAVSEGGGPNPLTGYTIISADSVDDAVAKALGCPIRESGGSIEVAELIEM